MGMGLLIGDLQPSNKTKVARMKHSRVKQEEAVAKTAGHRQKGQAPKCRKPAKSKEMWAPQGSTTQLAGSWAHQPMRAGS